MQNLNIIIASQITTNYSEFVRALLKQMATKEDDLMHAAIGISGEAGELLDAVKKTWVYGKPLDLANVKEEIGDILFYVTAMMNLLGLDENEIVYENVQKLEARYPGLTYSNEAAIARADKVGGEA